MLQVRKIKTIVLVYFSMAKKTYRTKTDKIKILAIIIKYLQLSRHILYQMPLKDATLAEKCQTFTMTLD